MTQYDERRFNRLALSGLVASFLLLAMAFALVLIGLRSARQSSDLVVHTYQVKETLNRLAASVERAETARRGYLLAPSDYRADTYRQSTETILPLLRDLGGLIADNPSQQRRLAAVRPLMLRELSDLDRSMSLAGRGDLAEARRDFATVFDFETLRSIRSQLGAMAEAEQQLLTQRDARDEARRNALSLFLVLVGVLLLLIATGTFLLVRRYTRDLTLTSDRLHVLNTDLEGAVMERTADLQRANEEIQRFAYIVSHDLRSPLVNVLGFTAELEGANDALVQFIDAIEDSNPDLLTEKARVAAREDLPEAIGFIRSSTQKMDRLINAILALSRQGQRVLAAQPLNMDELVGEIAGQLEMLAAGRDARFLIETPLPQLFHDRLAVEQVFSNLMENAVKYLAPGRPGVITVRGQASNGRAEFQIEDNGRGIAPADLERVFDLFRRAGHQDQAGEGIGLANVRALVYRLGGTVTVRSTLGEGSTFVVSLPTRQEVEGKSE